MERLSFVKNGVIRLPPGFRFHPTDEELVVQYLKRKAFACPLPASIIPEIDVCMFDPWELPGDGEQERYFFSTRKAKYRNGSRPNRGTNSGYWKATGLDKQIVASRVNNQLVGMKKTLVFYRGKPNNGSRSSSSSSSTSTRTDWVMHEYRLAGAGISACISPLKNNSDAQVPTRQMEDWVLCRIFLKKRSTKDDDLVEGANQPRNGGVNVNLIDFMKINSSLQHHRNPTTSLSPTSSCSASSGVTELSSSAQDDENTCNSVSSSPRRREP
ncbi:hypothetical protein Scep_018257 [Stephania cephalantha]|uniref:NAC domain-containing protein n=1 Tax=Stephania cephalantha TaxID=152367 RepID=A0AAP0IR24_9MAGN